MLMDVLWQIDDIEDITNIPTMRKKKRFFIKSSRNHFLRNHPLPKPHLAAA